MKSINFFLNNNMISMIILKKNNKLIIIGLIFWTLKSHIYHQGLTANRIKQVLLNVFLDEKANQVKWTANAKEIILAFIFHFMILNFPGRTSVAELVATAGSFLIPFSGFPIFRLIPSPGGCIAAGNRTSCPNRCGSYRNPDL